MSRVLSASAYPEGEKSQCPVGDSFVIVFTSFVPCVGAFNQVFSYWLVLAIATGGPAENGLGGVWPRFTSSQCGARRFHVVDAKFAVVSSTDFVCRWFDGSVRSKWECR